MEITWKFSKNFQVPEARRLSVVTKKPQTSRIARFRYIFEKNQKGE